MFARGKSLPITALALGLAAMPAAAATPSFDCERARSPVERAICADDELAALDVQLAKTFATVLAKAPAHSVNELKDAQASWRKTLLDCGKASDLKGCVVKTYQERLQQF